MPFRLHFRKQNKSPTVSPGNGDSTAQIDTLPHRSSSRLQVPQPGPAHQHLDETPVKISQDGPRDLWDEAYNALRASSPRLVKQYEQSILSEDNEMQDLSSNEEASQPRRRQQELLNVVSKTVQKFEEGGEFRIAGRKVDVRKATESVVKFVMFAKDSITSAVSPEPHAALAWAGICVFLPLLLNSTTQRDAAVTGFESIIFLVHRYQLIDNLRRPDRRRTAISHSPDTAPVISDLENKIVQLYGKIYEYQIRLVRQYSHAWAVRFGRDIFRADDWAKMLADMRLIDTDCSRLTDVLGQDELERSLKDNNHRIDDLVHRWQSSLQTLQTNVSEISTTIYQQIQQQKTRNFEERARDCIQLFRVGNRYEDQKNRNPNPHPNTCRWFLDNPKFHEWRDNECSSLLWVSANPGCGKSVLSRSLVDEVLPTSKAQDATICYFFFKDISTHSRNITTALAAIIHQLCSKKPSLIEHAFSAYDANGSELPNLFDMMWDILVTAAADPRAGEIMCVLDALDECEEPQQIVLIEKIRDFYSDPQKAKVENIKIRFLLTSRPYRQISARFHTLVRKFPTIHLSGDEESDQISEEIEQVLRIEVAAIASQKFFDAETEDFLLDQLLRIQNRTYLWLHLILDQIRNSDRASNAREMRREILALPQSISTAYEEILSRTTDRGLAKKVLHIIVGAERPLTVQELKVAMSIEDDSKSYKDLQLESDDGFALRMRNLCGLFISIDRSTVYLIHQTAKDFLIRRQGEPEPVPGAWQRSLLINDSRTMIATICLTFLMFTDFDSPSEGLCGSSDNYDITRYCDEHPFLGYASENWIEHFTELLENDVPTERWKDVACLLDVESLRYQTWTSVYQSDNVALPLNATNVIIACYLGFKPLLEHLIPTCSDINHQASNGATALDYAVATGDTDMVRILLENGADIQGGNWENPWHTELDEDGSEREVKPLSGPPVWMAATNENHDMIRFLVDQGASIDARDSIGFTALQWSYELRELFGKENIHVLLDCGADVNLTYDDSSGAGPTEGGSVSFDESPILKKSLGPDPICMPVSRSLLLSAVYQGDADAVELFLKHGADPSFSFTVGIVDEQLTHVEMDKQETSSHFESSKESPEESIGRSPEDSLIDKSDLAEHGSENSSNACISSLEKQASDDWAQSMFQISEITVTHVAVSRNETQILASLLSYGHYGNYGKTTQSSSNETPQPARSTSDKPTLLHLAAILGYVEIAALLLDAGVLDINAKDHEGETALTKAVKWGREGVRDLIEKKMAEGVGENISGE